MPTLPKAGRYELLDELGRGAMGVVYKAYDPVIGRTVAVKTLRLSEEGTGMTRQELIARFQTEARAAGLLSHPNIVVVYDAGEEEGLFYITMELIEGRSVQSLLDARQSFPLPRVLRLMEQACSALEFAHQRNVVHRDIKPANLMLTPDDAVKITDFGTAKILQFGATQTAHIIGTPSYMSPEQVKGKLVDGRSDIFSLGVILYELVTSEKPFPGQNITTVIYKIVNEDPTPPRELDPSVHPGLSYVITRALAKEPAARYQSCRELMEALRNYRSLPGDSEATVAVPAPGTERRSGAASAVREPASAAGHSAPARAAAAAAAQPKKRGGLWLALLLIAIIFGASYYIWPHVQEVWQRSRATVSSSTPDVAEQPQSPPSGAPAGQEATHGAPPDAEKPAEGKPAAPATLKASDAAPRAAAEAELKSRIERRLAEAGLADKVHVRVAGNTATLSGRLNPREHRQLLMKLRDAPAWVRVVDHIEYAIRPPNEMRDDSPRAPGERPEQRAGVGWVLVRSTPRGAEIFVDDVATGQRTPARLELSPGQHSLTLSLRGLARARQTILIKENQTEDIHLTLR